MKLGGLGCYQIALIQLGSISVTRVSDRISRLTTLLTRWWNAVLKPAVPELAKFDLVWRGSIAIALTIQRPDLISYRQIPVLHYPLRKELEVGCWKGKRTARKMAKTMTSSMNGVQHAILHTYPTISSPAKHI